MGRHNEHLLRLAQKISDRSIFYKSKFHLDNISSMRWGDIPFTTKSELLKDQEDYPPYGNNLSVKAEKVLRIHKTSGTTNKPLFIYLTKNDILNTIKIGEKCFRSAGLGRNDVVIHCLSYNMWAGGYTDHQSLERTGAAVIPFGVGNSHNLIEMILLLKPTAIHCTPSYLKKLELILKNDFNLSPRNLGLRLGLFGAEPGIQNPIFRNNIEELWGIKAMNANYGMSDVLSMFGAECQYQCGLHFFGEHIIFPELLDTHTFRTINIKKDSIGELVLTNLLKESQPLIRYRSNDIIKIISTSKCKCGYKGFTFEVIGRSDDMIVVKGVNVFINSIEKIVSEYSEINSGVIKILVNKKDPIDKVQIQVELKDVNIDKIELSSNIKKNIQKKLYFSPELYILGEGELERSENKSQKLFRIL